MQWTIDHRNPATHRLLWVSFRALAATPMTLRTSVLVEAFSRASLWNSMVDSVPSICCSCFSKRFLRFRACSAAANTIIQMCYNLHTAECFQLTCSCGTSSQIPNHIQQPRPNFDALRHEKGPSPMEVHCGPQEALKSGRHCSRLSTLSHQLNWKCSITGNVAKEQNKYTVPWKNMPWASLGHCQLQNHKSFTTWLPLFSMGDYI